MPYDRLIFFRAEAPPFFTVSIALLNFSFLSSDYFISIEESFNGLSTIESSDAILRENLLNPLPGNAKFLAYLFLCHATSEHSQNNGMLLLIGFSSP